MVTSTAVKDVEVLQKVLLKLQWSVPAGSPSRDGDVVVCVKDVNQPSLSTPFYSCAYFCLHGPFNCISFHKFSRQLFAFLLCPSGLNFALMVLSTIYLFMKVSAASALIYSFVVDWV